MIPRYGQQSIPQKKYYIPYNKPDKRASNDLITSLFIKAQTDTFQQLKETIVREKILLASVDDENRSILTFIQNNTRLTSADKFEMFKMCCKFGAPLDIPDLNGVRPIHIASMQQNKPIVDYLLKMKADPNGSDNQYMTPLHYAMQPEPRKCEIRKGLIDQIIPRNREYLKTQMTELSTAVYDYISTEVSNKSSRSYKLITHLKNIFSNTHLIEPEEYEDEINNSIKEIISKHPQSKSSTLKNKRDDMLLEMHKKITKSINDRIKINPIITNIGLKPERNRNDKLKQVNNILPVYDNFMDTIKQKNLIATNQQDIYEKIMNKHDEITKSLENNGSFINRITALLRNIQLIHNGSRTLRIDELEVPRYFTFFNDKFRKVNKVFPSANLHEIIPLVANASSRFLVNLLGINLTTINTRLQVIVPNKTTFFKRNGLSNYVQMYYHLLELACGLVMLDHHMNAEQQINLFKQQSHSDQQILRDLYDQYTIGPPYIPLADIFILYDEWDPANPARRRVGNLYLHSDIFNNPYQFCKLTDGTINRLTFVQPQGGGVPQHDYYIVDAVGALYFYSIENREFKKTAEDFNKDLHNLYKGIQDQIENFNKAIDMMNILNATRYITKFADSTDDTLTIDDEYTPSIIHPFNLLPDFSVFKQSISRFIDPTLTHDHMNKDKFIDYMYENYVYRRLTRLSYYDRTQAVISPLTGYFINLALRRYPDDRYGRFGMIDKRYRKIDKYLDSIPDNLTAGMTPHINSIKYMFIRSILDEIKNPTVDRLIKRLSNDNQNIIKGLDSDTMPYYLIAQTVDLIFDQTVKNMIENISSSYVHQLIKKNTWNSQKLNIYILPNEFTFSKQSSSTIVYDALAGIDAIRPDFMHFINDPIKGGDYGQSDNLINQITINNPENICISIDPGIVSLLITYGADIGSKAIGGITPLMLAIYLQNIEVVKQLINSGASTDRQTFNFMKHLLFGSINSSPILTTHQITENIIKTIREKTQIDRPPLNSLHIIPMAMYLLDNQISIYSNRYPNMWDYDTHQRVLNIAGIQHVSGIPIASIDLNEMNVVDLQYDRERVYVESRDKLEYDLIQKRDILIRLTNSKRNLEKEQTDPSITPSRNAEINNILEELKKEIAENNQLIQDQINQINQIIAKNIPSTTNRIKKKYSTFSATSNDCIDMYDKFFKHISNNQMNKNGEYVLYIKLWRMLLETTKLDKKNDHTQIVSNLYKNIIQNKQYDRQIFAEVYYPVVEYFEKILKKYSENYTEISTYYVNHKEFFGVKHLVDIMKHVFTHTMSYDLVTTLKEILIKMNIAHTQNITNKKDHLIIAAQILVKSNVIDYIMERLPLLMIKSVCMISEGEDDPDIKKTSDELLNRVVELLEKNGEYNIDQKVFELIKEKVIPFFKEYMEMFTREMFQNLKKQLNLFIEQSRLLRIQMILCGV